MSLRRFEGHPNPRTLHGRFLLRERVRRAKSYEKGVRLAVDAAIRNSEVTEELVTQLDDAREFLSQARGRLLVH